MNYKEILTDSLLDTLKSALFLYAAYLLIEWLEHRAQSGMISSIKKAEKYGPAAGAVMGLLPQCGFAVLCTKLYDAGAVTIGTLLAVLISTSDEAIIVLMADTASLARGAALIIIKMIIAAAVGFCCDGVVHRLNVEHHVHENETGVLSPRPHHESEHHDHGDDNCHCDCGGKSIAATALRRTAKTSLFIFAVLLVLGVLTERLGEGGIASLLLAGTPWQAVACALVGLIPGCAPSIVMAQLFVSGALSFGGALAGLITSTGVGCAVFFKTRGIKRGAVLVLCLAALGSVAGVIADLVV